MRGPAWALALAPLLGCGADPAEPAPADAGSAEPDTADAALRLPPPPDLPAPPEPVRLPDWTCPDGWLREPVGEGYEWAFSACAPPPRVACRGATVQGVADAACRPIGPPCPPDDAPFPTEEELRARAPGFDGPVLYVLPGAAAGGDGMRQAPFGSLGDALASGRAVSGTLLALGRGALEEWVSLDGRYALVGACVEGTQVAPPVREGHAPAVLVSGEGGTLVTGLSVTSPAAGIGVDAPAVPVLLRQVLVHDTVGSGIWLWGDGGQARLEDVAIRDTRAWEDGSNATALFAAEGVVATLDGVVIERSAGLGIWVGEGGTAATVLDGSGVALLETSSTDEETASLALTSDRGAVVRLARLLVAGCDDTCLGVTATRGDGDRALEVTDAVIRDAGRGPVVDGTGILVGDGAAAVLTRVLVERARPYGVHVTFPTRRAPARLEARHLVVRDTAQVAGGSGGWGLLVEECAEATLAHVVVHRSLGAGLYLGGCDPEAPTVLVGEDIVVAEVAVADPEDETPDGRRGAGLDVESGSRVELTRVRIERSADFGVTLAGNGLQEPLEAVLRDLVVADGGRGSSDGTGWGLVVLEGAHLVLERAALERNLDIALVVGGLAADEVGTVAEVADLAIRDTESHPVYPTRGRGAVVQDGGRLTGARLLLEDNREYGLVVMGQTEAAPAVAELEHVTIRRTRPAACGELPPTDARACLDDAGRTLAAGTGLGVKDGGRARLRHLHVSDSSLAGVFVAGEGRADLRQGQVTGNEVGVNLLVDDPAEALVSEDLYVFGNRTDAARRDLPLPARIPVPTR